VTKLLLFVAFAIGVVLWFKHQAGKREALPRDDKPAEDMVRCEVCKVNLPRSEAILSQGKFYCCDEHRRSGT
jgi:uncharacterized protein